MSSRQNVQQLVEKLATKADIKKTFLKDLSPIPLEMCMNILEDIDRLLENNLPASQTKRLAGYSVSYYQLTSGVYRVIYRKEPWRILFVFHKNKQKQILKHLR